MPNGHLITKNCECKWTMIPSSLIGAVTMQENVSITYPLTSNRRISKSHILDYIPD